MTYSEWHKKQARRRREAAAIRAMYWVLAALLVGAFLALLLVPGMARADDAADRLQKFAVLATFAAIDYDQSAGWVTPGGKYPELNPILGEHPTRMDMLAFGGASIGLLWLAAELLPAPWAAILLDSAISTEQLNIEMNAELKAGLHPRVDALPIIVTVRF
jgi:hypothetical protein